MNVKPDLKSYGGRVQVISCRMENFASYRELDFTFDNQGLCLIQGATGSGKSTLCDAIPWILFGRTAKDGAVDEVLSWNAEGLTTGSVYVSLPDGRGLNVTRTRGEKQNDLYYCFQGAHVRDQFRGRDLNDTQKLINNLLGMDHNLYLSASYFHEFSPTAQFFQTTAKNRRVLCEQLVDLSLAKKLQPRLAEQIKELNTKNQSHSNDIQLYIKTLAMITSQIEYINKTDNFEKRNRIEKQIRLCSLEILADSYIAEQMEMLKRAKIELGSDRCKECGSKKHSDRHESLARLEYDLQNEIKASNRAKDNIYRLELELKAELNKTPDIMEDLYTKHANIVAQSQDASDKIHSIETQIADLELLQDLLANLRAVSIKNTIQQLEDQTNQLLSKHFDAEIKVMFEVESADKLDVTIMKDGNNAVFTQLSKGQRQLLKLCFGISVMRIAANHNGISTNCIFLDEAFDGLSEELKVKAYGLLETLRLEYSSIFVVEHSQELKSLFTNQFTVQLINGNSVING